MTPPDVDADLADPTSPGRDPHRHPRTEAEFADSLRLHRHEREALLVEALVGRWVVSAEDVREIVHEKDVGDGAIRGLCTRLSLHAERTGFPLRYRLQAGRVYKLVPWT